MADRLMKSRWLRIACAALSLVFLILSMRAFQTNAPLTVEGNQPSIGGHAALMLDRSVVAFPGDCTWVSWATSAAREVKFNYQKVSMNQNGIICVTPWLTPAAPTLTVTYLNGAEQTLAIVPKILSLEPSSWLYPCLLVLALLGALQPWHYVPVGKRVTAFAFVALAIVLSGLTVAIQISDKSFDRVMSDQQTIHYQLMSNTSRFNQWQYRVLSEYIAEGALRVGDKVGLGYPAVSTMIRLAQNGVLFLLAAYYFTLLGGNSRLVLIGLMLASWAIVNSNYDLALVFDTFGDIIFYLLAAMLIIRKKFVWIIPLTFLASLNRETSGLIPVLLFFSQLQFRPFRIDRRVFLISAASMAVWLAAQLLVRSIYGFRAGEGNYGHMLGLDLVGFNVGREITWRELFSTLNLVPLLALLQLRRAQPILQRFFWTLVPIWVIIHFASGVVAESRLFLVPMIVVLIPMALSGFTPVSATGSTLNGANRYAESEQAGTLSSALPEPETRLSTGA